jgi:integrase
MGKDGLWFRDGECWYLDATLHGRRIRRSLRTANRQEAIAKARQLIAKLDQAGPVALRAHRTTFEDLVQWIVDDYESNKRRSIGKLLKTIARLRSTFGGWRATRITDGDVAEYIDRRRREGAANATINRELAALKRSFRLATRRKRVSHDDIPNIDFLKEPPPRRGFFERDQFEAVRRHLPAALKPVVTTAYITGWRVRSEILPMQWRQVDLATETIRLDPGTTKNDEGRLFVMTPELKATLAAQWAETDALQRETGQTIPSVFHRDGKLIKSFRRAWLLACKQAGVPGRIPHDFRRTAVRNLERAGIARSVAMKMVGHRTESIYRRYAIVSEGDLREAAKKLAAIDQGPWNGDASGSHRTHEPETVQNTPSPQHQVAGGPRRRSTDGSKR